MGKRVNMLGAYGEWASGYVGDRPGRLSLRNRRWSEVGEWKGAARAKLDELLCAPRETLATDVKIHARHTFDGLDIEEISWQLPYGPRTEAFFLKPRGARGRLPAVLALHDHGGNKHFGKRKITRLSASLHSTLEGHQRCYYGGVGWANEIAKRGFGVLVPDVFPFESRRIRVSDLPLLLVERLVGDPAQAGELSSEDPRGMEPAARYEVSPVEPEEAINTYNVFAGQHESVVAKSLFCAGLSWPGLMVCEDQAALGYLASRDDVDAGRIGCCGLSGGGLRTVFLAGIDDRIRCAVTVGMMTTWRDYLLNKSFIHTWMIYVPGLPGFLDFPEIYSLRAPLPAMVMATTEDPLFTRSETERAIEILREVYNKAGSPDAFHASWHGGPHKFDLPMQKEAFEWLRKWLG